MNLDLDLSAVPRLFRSVLNELRQKRLWPVAAVLLAAIVAVPFLLSSSGSPGSAPQAQIPTPAPAPVAALPTLNVQSTPSNSHVRGTPHDPFASGATTTVPHATVTTVTPSVSTAFSSTPSTVSSGASSNSGASTNTSSGSPLSTPTSSSIPTSTPPSITHGAMPKPAPSGLKPTQAYDVSLALTNSSGGVNTIDRLTRLSMVPSAQNPLLVELGVAQAGHRVLFAVQPGTIVSGPGVCTPGPIDCEVLSLGANQTEKLSTRAGSLNPSEVAQFQVTRISVNNYSSSAAATRARRAHSSAGQTLLAKFSLTALSLFRYELGVGSVVDLRNLKVGR